MARSGFASGRIRQGLSVVPYGFGYGDGYLPYEAGTSYGYTSPPNLIIVPPPPSPAVVQPPPRETKAVIHEYTLPGSAPQGEPPTFAIIMKDGSVRAASAVFVTNNVLHYVDPEEKNLRVSMDKVDREATLKLNRERKLNLWLPSTPQISDATGASR